MQISRFEDIIAWQKAKILTSSIYSLFRASRDYSFRDQIQRASVSIMNNIAEGFERKGNKEFRNFLYIAKGSCAEVRSMILLAQDLEYIPKDKIPELLSNRRKFLECFPVLSKHCNITYFINFLTL